MHFYSAPLCSVLQSGVLVRELVYLGLLELELNSIDLDLLGAAGHSCVLLQPTQPVAKRLQ